MPDIGAPSAGRSSTAAQVDAGGPSLASQLMQACHEAPAAIVALDRDRRYRYANAAAVAMLGLPADVIGRDAEEVHPDVASTPFAAAYRRVLTTAVPETVEQHYRPLDTYLRAEIWPWPDGVMIMLTDTTGERRPQARLERSLDLYQQVLEHTTEAIALRDLEGRFLLVNRAAAERLGRPPEEILGCVVEDVYPAELAAAIRQVDELVQGTGELQDSPAVRALYPDGRVSSRVFPVRDVDGSMIGIATTVVDLTELYAAQAELAASHRRFRRVFGSTSLGIVLTHLDGRIIEANSAICRMLGYSRAELLRMSGRDLLPLERRDPGLRRARLMAEGAAGYEIEEQLIRRDGKAITALLTINVLDDPAEGQIVSTLVRDMTEVHELQRQLLAAERMEAVGRLAAGIVHDANNILAAVSGYAELLADELHGRAAAQRHLDGISRAVQRANAMVAQLLAFSRGQPTEPGLVDLAHLIRDLEDMLRQLLPPGVTLVLDLWPAAVWVDSSQIRQVVLNLVVNARNAVDGSGTIRISTGSADEGSVLLAVSDDGPGMPPEVARRCFEPFFTTRQSSGGSGVGLSTAHGIALQSGGDLRVRTAVDAGTTFELVLPAAVPPRTRAGSSGRESDSAPMIIVAEDDEEVRGLMASTLEAAGYRVTTAEDGTQAMAVASSADLVVTDVDMPSMTGLELAGRLLSDRPGLQVLLVSGSATTQAGPNRSFLAKPFTRSQLLGAVEAALGARP